ncbi:MAG: DUF368 domain-containing protein [Wenzhouxiangella sp.]|nr:MAG: DUF368 domain-containing protein [Wenzhouxiangella sp.]
MARSPLQHLALTAKGAAMGVADLVPGVSGGTIALVTGIYEELIASLARIGPERWHDFRRGGLRGLWRSINGSFLVAVFSGLLLAILTMAELMKWLLDNHRVVLWGFFFGLILASVPLVLMRLKRWRWRWLPWLLAGVGIGLGITLLGPGSTPEALWMIFLAGLIAVSAMVLPGISGSFLLLLMAQYETMVTAVVERDLLTIVVFAVGAVIGALSISRLLAALFRRHHDRTIALLTGFMLGSLNALWPWQYGIAERGGLAAHYWPWQFETVSGQAPQLAPVILAFLAGLILIGLFARIDLRSTRISSQV